MESSMRTIDQLRRSHNEDLLLVINDVTRAISIDIQCPNSDAMCTPIS